MKRRFRTFVLLCVVTCCFLGCENLLHTNIDMPLSFSPLNKAEPTSVVSKTDGVEPSLATEAIMQEATTMTLPAKLVVNGRDITEGNHIRINYESNIAELPILTIFRELGHDADMQDCGNGIYQAVIDQEIVFLSTKYEDYGIPVGYGEEGCVRQMTETEFIIDSKSISSQLFWTWNIDVEVDYESGVVYINSFNPDDFHVYQAQLIVNGKDITEGNEVSIREYYNSTEVELPLLAIAKELGAQIIWEESTVTIRHKGMDLILDLTKSDFGYAGAFDGTWIRRATNKEVFMEMFSVKNILSSIMAADLSVDYKNRVIRINSMD